MMRLNTLPRSTLLAAASGFAEQWIITTAGGHKAAFLGSTLFQKGYYAYDFFGLVEMPTGKFEVVWNMFGKCTTNPEWDIGVIDLRDTLEFQAKETEVLWLLLAAIVDLPDAIELPEYYEQLEFDYFQHQGKQIIDYLNKEIANPFKRTLKLIIHNVAMNIPVEEMNAIIELQFQRWNKNIELMPCYQPLRVLECDTNDDSLDDDLDDGLDCDED